MIVLVERCSLARGVHLAVVMMRAVMMMVAVAAVIMRRAAVVTVGRAVAHAYGASVRHTIAVIDVAAAAIASVAMVVMMMVVLCERHSGNATNEQQESSGDFVHIA